MTILLPVRLFSYFYFHKKIICLVQNYKFHNFFTEIGRHNVIVMFNFRRLFGSVYDILYTYTVVNSFAMNGILINRCRVLFRSSALII